MKIYFRMFYLFKNGIIPKEQWHNYCILFYNETNLKNKKALQILQEGE